MPVVPVGRVEPFARPDSAQQNWRAENGALSRIASISGAACFFRVLMYRQSKLLDDAVIVDTIYATITLTVGPREKA